VIAVGRIPLSAVAVHPIVEAALRTTLFTIVALAPLLAWSQNRRTLTSGARVSYWLLSGATGYLFLASGALAPRDQALTAIGATILVSAFAEEVVFRVKLPALMLSLASRRGHATRVLTYGSVVIAQLSFAACHVLPDAQGIPPSVLARLGYLTAIGLLYAELLRLTGLPFTAAVHAAGNLDLMFNPRPFHSISHSPELILWLTVGLALVASREWSDVQKRLGPAVVPPGS
jgi:hypothetical protein